MAKITMIFEDTEKDGTLIVSDPAFEEMAAIAARGIKLTSAQGYAAVAWMAIKAEALRAADAGKVHVSTGTIN